MTIPIPQGYLCFVLHGHLPFVRHPERPEVLEEDWLFEAITEVYLPLLDMLYRLCADGIACPIAVSLSPPLLSMLSDPLLKSRYDAHLENLIWLAEAECQRTISSAEFGPLARMYKDRFLWCRQLWAETFHRDLVGAFRELGQNSQLELLTTAATHGFLPLMEVTPESLRAQVEVGCQSFQQFFGFRPKGFWLPECGYTPLVGETLSQVGIQYTLLETHGILHASPQPKFGTYAPLRSPSGLVLFGRDPETARQVWSSIEGYPGDCWYRDFYRDIGFDLDETYLKPFLYHGGLRVATGLKYYRVTGRADHKEPYSPGKALERIQEHAGNFLFNREKQVEYAYRVMGQTPVVVAMYDAELFGHWWHEGPMWLEAVFRRFHACPSIVQLATPSQVLQRLERIQETSAHLSTWGWKGYNEVWLQGTNAWTYRHLHQASWRMGELRSNYPAAQGLLGRALNQALRELLLAQSSDWSFILGQGTACEYAHRRLRRHLSCFGKLYHQIQRASIDENELAAIEQTDNLFPFLDYEIY